MTSPEFLRRLSDSDAIAVAGGTMRAQLENGTILENPKLWTEVFQGKTVQSLMGNVGPLKYSWPACGCGVRIRVRAIPLA